MEKIDGKWVHEGREYEVVDGPCADCHLYTAIQRSCGLVEPFACKVGLYKILQLKEPKT